MNINQKKFGFWSIVLLGINSVIGSGIFLLPGKAMELAGPGSIGTYLFMTFVVLVIALCYAECGGMFQRNGASYVYAREAFGEFIGFEVGIMRWVIGMIVWAAISVGFVTALSAVWSPALEEPYRSVIVSTIILGLAVLNILGVQLTKYVNNFVTLSKLLPLIIFISIGIFFIEHKNFIPVFPADFNLDQFGAAALLVFYAFTGFEALGIAAEDMENPQKNVPLALMLVIGICSLVYLSVQAVSVGTLGQQLSGANAPIAKAADSFLGPAGKWLVTIGTLISIGGINISTSFIVPRSGAALAHDGLLPKRIGRTSRFGTPYLAILITAVLALLLALSGSFVKLAAISVVARFAEYLPTCLAVLVLRYKRRDLVRTFYVPFGPIIPLLGIGIIGWLLTKATLEELVWGLGALAFASPFYLLSKLGSVFFGSKQLSGTDHAAK